MKISDNGKDTVTVDFGTSGKFVVNVNEYPNAVQQYGKLRGFRKIYSDLGAGFKGTEKQLKEKCEKSHKKLMEGDFRSGGERGVTVDELTAMFKKLAPEATEEAIQARVKATHPKFGSGKKDIAKRQRETRGIANAIKALDALK